MADPKVLDQHRGGVTLPKTQIHTLEKPALYPHTAPKGAALLQRHPPHNYPGLYTLFFVDPVPPSGSAINPM